RGLRPSSTRCSAGRADPPIRPSLPRRNERAPSWTRCSRRNNAEARSSLGAPCSLALEDGPQSFGELTPRLAQVVDRFCIRAASAVDVVGEADGVLAHRADLLARQDFELLDDELRAQDRAAASLPHPPPPTQRRPPPPPPPPHTPPPPPPPRPPPPPPHPPPPPPPHAPPPTPL